MLVSLYGASRYVCLLVLMFLLHCRPVQGHFTGFEMKNRVQCFNFKYVSCINDLVNVKKSQVTLKSGGFIRNRPSVPDLVSVSESFDPEGFDQKLSANV